MLNVGTIASLSVMFVVIDAIVIIINNTASKALMRLAGCGRCKLHYPYILRHAPPVGVRPGACAA